MAEKFIPEAKRWCNDSKPRVITITECEHETWVETWANLTAGIWVAGSPFRDKDEAIAWCKQNYPELPCLFFEEL